MTDDDIIVDKDRKEALELLKDEPVLGPLERELFKLEEETGNMSGPVPPTLRRRGHELIEAISACQTETVGGIAWRLWDLFNVVSDCEEVQPATERALKKVRDEAAAIARREEHRWPAPGVFVLGGRQGGDPRPRRPLSADDIVSLNRWREVIDDFTEHGLPVTGEPPRPPEPPPDLTDPAIVALRTLCEALAAEYREPLPEGDRGLAQAAQRVQRLRARGSAMAKNNSAYTMRSEAEIVNAIVDPARGPLEEFIEQTPAQGLLGVAAKLRYLIEDGVLGLGDVGGEQLLEVIEREIAQ